jgi:hypothetical protein
MLDALRASFFVYTENPDLTGWNKRATSKFNFPEGGILKTIDYRIEGD